VNAFKFLTAVVATLVALGAAPRAGRAEQASRPAKAIGETMPKSNPYHSQLTIKSRFTAKDFVPDGNLAKAVWKKAAWVKFDHDAFSPKAYPQSETEVASLWTPDYLYLAYRCKYTTLNIYEGEDPAKERWLLWERDVVEVFANPQPERVNHYYEFEVAPNNQWIDLVIDLEKKPFNDAKWDSGFEHATRIDPQKHVWTCEMRIPVHALDSPPLRPNVEWRINFFRADGPGPDRQRRHLSWSPVQSSKHSFHTPTSFGLIRFVK
jgi:hypothetical protein